MQIAAWNIILSSIIGVLVVAYGFWLKKIVSQQLASKDSTIENLGASLKSKDAEIARLQGETAPAIADSYKRVKEMADGLAKESNDLAARLKAMEAERKNVVPSVPSDERLTGQAEGFNEALGLLLKRTSAVTRNAGETTNISAQDLLTALSRYFEDTTERSADLTKSIREMTARRRLRE